MSKRSEDVAKLFEPSVEAIIQSVREQLLTPAVSRGVKVGWNHLHVSPDSHFPPIRPRSSSVDLLEVHGFILGSNNH